MDYYVKSLMFFGMYTGAACASASKRANRALFVSHHRRRKPFPTKLLAPPYPRPAHGHTEITGFFFGIANSPQLNLLSPLRMSC